MSSPSPPTLPPDPYLATEEQQAQNQLVTGLQSQTQGDMASLMARYGTQLALAGGVAGSPLRTPYAGSNVSATTGGIKAA